MHVDPVEVRAEARHQVCGYHGDGDVTGTAERRRALVGRSQPQFYVEHLLWQSQQNLCHDETDSESIVSADSCGVEVLGGTRGGLEQEEISIPSSRIVSANLNTHLLQAENDSAIRSLVRV